MSSGADARVTRLEPIGSRGLVIRVHTDHGDPLELMLEAIEKGRVGVGDALSERRKRELLDLDADIRVRHAALRLLSYRARTRAELGRRLRQKGFAATRVDACIDDLGRRGFLDDGAVAESFVRDRLRHRPRGKVRLTAELRARGVGRELAEHAIERVFDDEDVREVDVAERAAEAWVARQGRRILDALHAADPKARDRARRRLYGYLSRRGFRGEALQRAMFVALTRTSGS